MSSTPVPTGLVIDQTTVLSLLSTLAILAAAYITSLYALPLHATSKTRFLFIWHAFDALIHFILEGTFLYNCFFSYGSTLLTDPLLPSHVHFLNLPGRYYGAAYGSSWHSALWREYAKADARWAGTDLTVVSLELLTVFVGGPLAVWCCVQMVRGKWGGAWFWMCVLAVGELYGGFMTFVPEWLSGSPNLVTSNWMYKWVYLFFFNTLWVWIPFWILYQGYAVFTSAVDSAGSGLGKRKRG
ncbi:Emopamil-binding protein [Aureobasidium pullulans]|uniref:Emopamil-binding protein n=3 Tax=Aureobasidium pullulans TaxID=5580 RepID=A0A074X732_AURPU|nr:Emopamil-binding protein [Aureobasidium pullulans EXF-150]KEQ79569.1 Emopamil-binding protein [Aureobasidium pullulans EXF-150]THX22679.1 Emopamil-binding protein [Aureobasidium pullulans]THX36327.1 Emopamil-binding protein [Aureobasidium pullulans]TIA32434.1 Emopamil-binding protein [Aureobasidium pullulans]